MTKIDVVLAIDPSTGDRSNCGFVAFDPELGLILDVKEFKAHGKDVRKRIKQITIQAAKEMKYWSESGKHFCVFIESTVMMGKGGESLQRVIGALMAISPADKEFYHVSNMQVKAYVGGTGKADKEQVAAGLRQFFPRDPIIGDIIQSHRWDITDALAIGVTGYEKFITKSILTKTKTKKPAPRKVKMK